MDSEHFDRLTCVLTAIRSRRGLLGMLAALPGAGGALSLLKVDDAGAHGRRKRRKKRHKHGKGRRRQHQKRNKTCTPDAVTTTCAGKCGSVVNNCRKAVDCGACACTAHEQCGPDALCLDGECHACDVTCDGKPVECGATLQAAMDRGGTVYACPGTYRGGFVMTTGVTVIGAGEGEDDSMDTILHGNDAARVLHIMPGSGPVTLERLRIAHGSGSQVDEGGLGIFHEGTSLQMRDCTVADNTGIGIRGGGIFNRATLELTRCTVRDNNAQGFNPPSSSGGGICSEGGTLTLTDCLIERNHVGNDGHGSGGGLLLDGGIVTLAGTTAVLDNDTTFGGGIYNLGATLRIGANCRVEGNRALQGGGIYNDSGTVTLEGPDPSPIVVNNCGGNCAGDVPHCAPGGACSP